MQVNIQGLFKGIAREPEGSSVEKNNKHHHHTIEKKKKHRPKNDPSLTSTTAVFHKVSILRECTS